METQIHPTAIISAKAQIGRNVSIGPYSIVHDDVVIGDNTEINSYCEPGIKTPLANQKELVIAEKSIIRSRSTFYQGSRFGKELHTGHGVIVRENTIGGVNLQIGSLSDINGECIFGDYTRLHSNVFIGKTAKIGSFVWLLPYVLLTNDPHPPSNILDGATIEDYAVIAARAVILPSIKIGKSSLVAAGSVVTKDVLEKTVVGGVPAKILCDIADIKHRNNIKNSAYPWITHFHRGYPEGIVMGWSDIKSSLEE